MSEERDSTVEKGEFLSKTRDIYIYIYIERERGKKGRRMEVSVPEP